MPGVRGRIEADAQGAEQERGREGAKGEKERAGEEEERNG